MNNTKYTDDFQKELSALLTKIEELIKEVNEVSDHSQLSNIYSIVHKINESAATSGVNTLAVLFTPIENYISEVTKSNGKLSKQDLTIILSTTSLGYTIIIDPGLKQAGVKQNFENLKKQILSNFADKKQKEDISSFSNSRFQEIFVDEAIDLINQLEEKLLQLESDQNDTTLIDNVFRIMHTLKGNSNMFGFKHLGEITHHLENIYDAIRSQKLEVNHAILEITLQCIDHFRNLLEDPDLADASNKVIQESILNDIAEIMDFDSSKPTVSHHRQKATNTSEDTNSFYLFFKPIEDIFNDGSNPLFYVSDLHELGDCLVVPVMTEISQPEKFNPEICYTAWHILLATKENKDAIKDNFMFLRDDSQPNITVIAKGNLINDKNFVANFKNLAVESDSIEKQLLNKPVEADTDERDTQKSKSSAGDSSIASIRVASAKVDLMMNLISELVTKQAELSMLATNTNNAQLQEVAESIESISRDLRDNAFSISLIPLDKTVLRFQRLVRDVAAKFNKQVEFVVEGKDTELDKTIIEKIVDPIMHILRNSIDHGIETPKQRRELGKPEKGTITLKAYPSGAHVVIEISDDGSGINVEKVRLTAVRKGYLGANEELTTDEMIKLILSPGFSTADNVSEVSGRGVGMDVVHQKIKEIRGELDIRTQANAGTTIMIRLPLTISIIDSMLVLIGSTYYLIPLAVVQRCAEVKTPVITESPTKYINLEGEFIPFIDLHDEFKTAETRDEYQRLIMVNYKTMPVALVVDHIIGNHQAVLKALGQAYRRQEVISGASILGNGEVALVLDTNKLLQEFMANREEELEKIYRMSLKV
jgi:two-component system, chemotaxis family, sensor kinase CheA